MKILLFMLPLLYSCSTIANNKTPPSGELFYDVLLSMTDVKLSNEPLCNLTSVSRNTSELTFGNHLSTILSVSYKTNSTNTISSSCSISKHEKENKTVVDIWDCKLELKETNSKGNFISSSMVAFGINTDNLKYQAGTLRCF